MSYRRADMDELIAESGDPRPVATALMRLIDRIGEDELRARQAIAELDILTMGITFTVYSDGENIDRAWPFDIIPRVIAGAEWDRIERRPGAAAAGAQHVHRRPLQRPADHRRRRVPGRPARGTRSTSGPQCAASHPKYGVWAHISGTDLVRDDDGRCTCSRTTCGCRPGVSYVIENRGVTKRAFAELFERQRIRPVDGYTDELNRLLTLARSRRGRPTRSSRC